VFELGENTTGWDRLVDQFGAYIPLAMSPEEWQARLLVEPSDPVILYEDPADKPGEDGPSI